MYTKPQGRYPHSLRVPENYGGNAFPSNTSPATATPQPPEPEASIPPPPPPSEEATSPVVACPYARPRSGLSSLFSRFGKDGGMEELLIIGLILLLAEDGKNDDLILLLILLLFVQ